MTPLRVSVLIRTARAADGLWVAPLGPSLVSGHTPAPIWTIAPRLLAAGIMYLMYGLACVLSATLITASRDAHPDCLYNPTQTYCFTGANVVQTLMAVLIGSLSEWAPY